MAREHRTVLIIDDDPRVQELLKFHLEGVVDRIHGAKTPRDGLNQAMNRVPDVILLDLEMPLMDGFAVCRALKEDERTATIPVLFLTADRRVHTIARALDCGGMDYITKPFEVVELQARIRSALRMRRLVRTLEEKARLDALTGLDNRVALLEATRIAHRRFIKDRAPFSLLSVYVDQLPALNKAFGHAVGDEVVRGIAEVVRAWAEQCGGSAGRYEGGEFAVVVPGLHASKCVDAARELNRRIAREAVVCGERVVQVTASMGLMGAPRVPQQGGAEACIALSRGAMTQARERGGDGVVLQSQRNLATA